MLKQAAEISKPIFFYSRFVYALGLYALAFYHFKIMALAIFRSP